MGRDPIFTEERAQQMGDLYVNGGWSIKELCEEYGCCAITVRTTLRNYGFPYYKELKLSRPEIQEVIKLYSSGEHTQATLSKMFNVSGTTIYNYLRRVRKAYNDLKNDEEFQIQRKYHKITNPHAIRSYSEYIFDQYTKEFRTTIDIAKEFNVTRECVCQVLRELGVNLREVQRQRFLKKFPESIRKDIRQKYCSGQYLIKEISKEHNIPAHAVRNFLVREGIYYTDLIRKSQTFRKNRKQYRGLLNEHTDYIKEQYLAGRSTADLAKEFDVCVTTIYRILRLLKIKFRGAGKYDRSLRADRLDNR